MFPLTLCTKPWTDIVFSIWFGRTWRSCTEHWPEPHPTLEDKLRHQRPVPSTGLIVMEQHSSRQLVRLNGSKMAAARSQHIVAHLSKHIDAHFLEWRVQLSPVGIKSVHILLALRTFWIHREDSNEIAHTPNQLPLSNHTGQLCSHHFKYAHSSSVSCTHTFRRHSINAAPHRRSITHCSTHSLLHT